ncbi:MAG: sensor histidine kinase [Planctomycetota bacterium]
MKLPSRTGLALLLTLLIPAALTGAWGWLTYGGVIGAATEQEQREDAAFLDAAHDAITRRVTAAAAAQRPQLRLDAARRLVGPFEGPGGADSARQLSVAEATANRHLLRGDPEAALPFFAYAAGKGRLSPEGTLAYSAVLPDRAAAAALLDDAEERYRDTWSGDLPFALLAALQRARLDGLDDDGFAAMLELATRPPAAAVGAVADAIVAAAPDRRDAQGLRALRSAAAASLQASLRPVPETAIETTGGILLVPTSDRTVAALGPALVADLCAAAAREAERGHPGHELTQAALARAALQGRRTAAPASAQLTLAARTCLGLAIATLVLGNLLVWRFSRRELALVRMRRDFVDVVSHELRTPLTALSLKSEMLARGDVPAARRQHYLQALDRDVQRLTDQVQRILDFGRLERGAELQREVVPTRSVLARGLRAGMPALRLVDQRLDVDAPRGLPDVDVDLEVLTRALRNLLENAAKYAPPGSTVAVRATADTRAVTVEVADTGPGVRRDERAAIFQPFVRASSATPGIQGSGLGLALVASAARAHGGSVEVHDRDGGGAVFSLRLPIATGRERA